VKAQATVHLIKLLKAKFQTSWLVQAQRHENLINF